MMIRDSTDKVLQAKQEAGLDGRRVAPGAAAAGARTWAGLRDPRIVRVARSLGGKDRHSKVSTVKGLRDRRVRLSVPTAIQLYDLQDRLGLNQPSKVVDWLLDAAQHEIDKLPPLQIPPGCFLQYPQIMAASPGVVLPEEEYPSGPPVAASLEYRAKRRDPTGGTIEEKDGLTFFRRIEQEKPVAEAHTMGFPFNGDLLRQSHASMVAAGLPGSNGGEYAVGYHKETSNLCVSHLGCQPLSPGEELHGFRQPATSPPPPSVFSPYASAAAGYEPKHGSGFQMGSSALHGFMLGSLNSSLLGSSASIKMRPLEVRISSSKHHPSHNHHESNTTAE